MMLNHIRIILCLYALTSRLFPFFDFAQVVSASRLDGEDHPLEVVYFIEAASGHRMPATEAAHLLNSMDVQRAAIVLGYRVQGVLAQRECVRRTRMTSALHEGRIHADRLKVDVSHVCARARACM